MKRIFLLLIIIVVILSFKYRKNSFALLNNVSDGYVYVDKYYIYGNHLNIEGSFSFDFSGTASLVLKSLKNEINIPISIVDNKFFVSEFINDGLYLDAIPIDNYFVFFKVDDNSSVKYYNLINNTSYNNTQYYTVTRGGKNNLIDIYFSNHDGLNYMFLSSQFSSVGDNYYDVIIDPGHGGSDPGAVFSDYTEANINLDISLKLKVELEKLGLRVGITRDSDVYTYVYGFGSRTYMSYDAHSKYFISIHLNSTDSDMRYGGVEVYAPNNSNLSFASILSSKIVECAKTSYSKNVSFMVKDGVYVKTFSPSDIDISINDALKNGYTPYPIDTSTDYYFMIRETGGIVTNAYMDGRDNYSKNQFFNSNVGAEGYLLELGYINYSGDLDNLLNNSMGYINGIVEAFKIELGIE